MFGWSYFGRTKPNPLGIETDGGTVGMKEAPTS